MKIAYLSTFYPYRGGIAQFNASLFRELEKEADIRAYTFKRQYPNILFPGKSQFVQNDDNADPIPSKRTLDTINPLTYISASNTIHKFNPDLLIMKFWMPFFAPSLGYTARRLRKGGTKAITILDNVIPHERRPGDVALTKFFLNQNDAFIVMSESVRDDLLKLKPKALYKLMPHPLYDIFGEKIDSDEARERLDLPKDKKILLFFGFIRKYKGLDIALEAMNELGDDYILVVAGEPYEDFDEYREIIRKYDLEDKTRLFVRYITDEEAPLFFSSADLCIQPYRSATQSGIAGIALQFDLPMVATDAGGLKEIIEPNNIGLIADAVNPSAVAVAVKKYFENGGKPEYSKNIDKVKRGRSWSYLAENILELYEKNKSNNS